MSRKLLIAGIAVCWGAVAFAAAPTPDNMGLRWDPDAVEFEKDDPAPKLVTVLLDFTETGVDPYQIQGWSLGLCIDSTKIKVDKAAQGPDTKLWLAYDPELFPDQMPWQRVNVLADGTGVTAGVVIDFNGDVKVPTGLGLKALEVTISNVGLESTAVGTPKDSTEITSCDTLGSPPVIPVVVVDGDSIGFGSAAALAVTRAQTETVNGKPKLELVAEGCVAAVHLTTNTKTVDAVSLGVSHTGNFTLKEIGRGAATADADYFGARIVTGGGTLGVVMSLDDPITPLPASEQAAEIARFSYCYPVGGAAGTTDVALTDTLGDPPAELAIDSGGTTLPADEVEIILDAVTLTIDCQCEAVVDETFVRGDANQDSKINISDGVYIARALFGIVDDKGCADALDTNDDEVLDPADPIYLLNYLFMGGPAIKAPVPANLRAIVVGDCGLDPAGDTLKCATYAICPR